MGSAALKTVVPATSTSAPAATNAVALVSLTPPSNSVKGVAPAFCMIEFNAFSF